MARPDKVMVSFRGKVAANLAGVWGDSDLINVKSDANGELIAAIAGDAEGVIWTPEGKSDSSVANFKTALAGDVLTVFSQAIITGVLDTVAGDGVWSAAAGDVVTSIPAAPIQKIGQVYAGDDNEDRLVLNVTQTDDA